MQSWIQELPDALRRAGVSLTETGVQETSFRRNDALAVIEAMRRSGETCLGGDEWTCIDGHFRPTLRNWYVLRARDEPPGRLAERSWAEAFVFVGGMPPDAFVVFVVGPYHDPEGAIV